jgi:hypothetical protein
MPFASVTKKPEREKRARLKIESDLVTICLKSQWPEMKKEIIYRAQLMRHFKTFEINLRP